jgi:uncharacterized protein involved in high-affinity Fe2+ transport
MTGVNRRNAKSYAEGNTMKRLLIASVASAFATWGAMAQLAEPRVKTLTTAADPMEKAILIGRLATGDMVLQLELEGSKAMWMQMGKSSKWGAHTPKADERYHVEFKLTDPKSKTRIPYANITFSATNLDSKKAMKVVLPPMWGSSGLHYAANSTLLGNGSYLATVTVAVPTFERGLKDKDLWAKPVSAKFHFKLMDGKLTEVSEVSQ